MEDDKSFGDIFKEEFGIKGDILYSIIFSMELEKGNYFTRLYPTKKEYPFWKKFYLTEKYKEELSEEEALKVNKFCGILTQEEFDEFVNWFGLGFDCDTLGALGTPAYPMCLSPAVSFSNSGDYDGYYNAYITPVWEDNKPPQEEQLFDDKEYMQPIDWDRIVELFKKYYEW